MRSVPKALLSGLAAAVLTGVAFAAADRTHVLNVAMPDGSVAQVRYVGDVPPQVVVADPAPVRMAAFADPFAMMDRIAFDMDRQMDAMLHSASLMALAAPAASGQVSEAALKQLPPGTVSYSYTSYSSSNGAQCSQSVQVTALRSGEAPKVERQSNGDCSAMNRHAPTPAVQQVKPTAPVVTPANLDKAKVTAGKTPVI